VAVIAAGTRTAPLRLSLAGCRRKQY